MIRAAALDDRLFAAAGLSWAAALIHVAAAVDHLRESVLFAGCFALLAPFQLLWGLGAVCRAPSPRLLRAGAIVSLGVVAVWVLSRTTGLPVGPEPWRPEAIGVADVAASADELAIAMLVVLGANARGRGIALALAVALIGMSCVALAGGGHAH